MHFTKIFFDFDSTLVHEETLDFLASRKGVGEEVSRLTAQSMEGLVPVQEVFRKKMGILSPSRTELADLATHCHSKLLTRDAAAVISALHFLEKEVYILSSGLHEIIDTTAKELGIPLNRVLANRIVFDDQGGFLDITDEEVPIAPDGKAQALRRIPEAKLSGVMVGDAVTDLAASSEAALFVGFGGVVKRKRVEDEAAVYISCRSLGALLTVVLATEEFERLLGFEEHCELAARARRLEGYVRRR